MSEIKYEESLSELKALKNDKFKDFEINQQKIQNSQIIQDTNNIEITKTNMRFVKRISFQLSNLCNYSIIHKKCPVSSNKDKIILPSNIFYKTINEISEYEYKGVLSFHVYNEPLIDPRLFMFIKYAKEKCPDSVIFITSNGYYLNQTMLDELKDIGVDAIFISAYSKVEYERLISLQADIGYCVFPMELDNRMSMYESAPLNLNKQCSAPLNEICIAPTGNIFICCLDWKQMHTFGDLTEKTLLELVDSPKMTEVYNNLKKGIRNLHLCERCFWTR